MISLATACDSPVDVTALPDAGGAAAVDGQDLDLFNAVLGQMLGDGKGGSGIDGDDAGDLETIDTSIDPTELVNPMIVDGMMLVVPTPAPILWSLSIEANRSELSPQQQSLEELAASAESLGDSMPVAEPTGGPRLDSAGNEDAAEFAQLESLARALTGETTAANTEAAPSASSTAKPERIASTKGDKSKVEAKNDAAVVRPVPAFAIERAYTSNDREFSKSFDRSNDQTPSPRFQPFGQAASATTFVVPADVRPLVATPTPAVTLETGGSVVVDPTIEMQVPAQIVQSIRMQAIDGGGEAILRLRPEYLGEVVVAVRVEQGSVTAALQADTPAVRQWVERNEAVLRQGLAEHGLQLDRLTVSEKAAETENESHPEQQQPREEPSRQQSRRRRQPADDATFEVTV